MKKSLAKCLILGFYLSVLPCISYSSTSCNRVLIAIPVMSEQISSTIQELAKLKLNLDIAKLQGSTSTMDRKLEKKFSDSFAYLTQEMGFGTEQIQAQIKHEIQKLQGLLVEKKTTEDLARQAEKEALTVYPIQLATKEQLQAQETEASEIRARYKKSKIKVGFFANRRAKKWHPETVQVVSEPTSRRDQVTFLMQNRSPVGNWMRVELIDRFDRLVGEVLYDVQSESGVQIAVKRALGEAWSNNNFFNVRKINLSMAWGDHDLNVTQDLINEALDIKRYVDVLEVPNVEVNVSKINPFEPNRKKTVNIPSTMSALRGDFPTKLNSFHGQSKKWGEFEEIIQYSNEIFENGLASHRAPRHGEAYLFFLEKYGLKFEYEQ